MKNATTERIHQKVLRRVSEVNEKGSAQQQYELIAEREQLITAKEELSAECQRQRALIETLLTDNTQNLSNSDKFGVNPAKFNETEKMKEKLLLLQVLQK